MSVEQMEESRELEVTNHLEERGMEEVLTIDEDDIFKYLVRREDIEVRDTKEALKMFFNRLPINIFKDEYYIIYNMMSYAHQYNATFNEFQLYDMLSNSADVILSDVNIRLHKSVPDDMERLDLIYVSVQNKLDDLKEEDTEGDISNMMLSLKLYIDKYVENKLQAVSIRYAKMLGGEILKRGNLRYSVEESTEAFDKSRKVLFGLLNEQIEALSGEIDTGTMTVEDLNERFNREGRLQYVAKFGLETLDNKLGGIKKTNYVAVQAGGGIGKSRFGTVNISYNALMLGKNVLIDSLELPSEQLFSYFLARHILMKYGNIEGLDTDSVYTRQGLTEEQVNYYNLALVDFMNNEEYGRLKIRDELVDVDNLEVSLERVWEGGFHFDVYCLDYIGLVGYGKHAKTKHEAVTRVSNYLKVAVKNFKGVGFAAVILSQISKEGEDALLNGAESVKLFTAESHDIYRDCDIMVTLHADEDMKVENRMMLYVEKSRHVDVSGSSRVSMETDLGRCFFQEA